MSHRTPCEVVPDLTDMLFESGFLLLSVCRYSFLDARGVGALDGFRLATAYQQVRCSECVAGIVECVSGASLQLLLKVDDEHRAGHHPQQASPTVLLIS